jgi:hypothetical protein
MRKCDFCAREVQDEAVYCRYCHREIPRNEEIAGKKRCPYCAEWVDRGAIVCPFCALELGQGAGTSRVYRPDRPEGAPRFWDPRDVLRSSAVPPFTSEPATEGEKRSILGRIALGRTDRETPPEAPAIPLRASEPIEEPPTGPKPGLIRRLVTAKEATPDVARQRPTEPRGTTWGAEPRPPEGPLAPRLFAGPQEPPESLTPLPQPRTRNSSLLGFVVIAALGIIGVVIVLGSQLAGFDFGSLMGGISAAVPTDVATTPTSAPAATAPLLPGPSSTPEPTSAVLEPTPTAEATADCLLWDQVTVDHMGQTVCVYGEVKRRYTDADFAIVVIFSEEPGAFIVVDRGMPHPEVDPGVCVMVIGEVEVMSRVRPFIDAEGEILICQ